MVTSIVRLAPLLLAACSSTSALPSFDDGASPQRKLSGLPGIDELIVEQTSRASSTQPNTDCTDFTLDADAAKSFLQRASAISEYDYRNTADWAPCYAIGRASFANGRWAVWVIQQYGAASLRFDDGDRIFLYCPECIGIPD